MPRMGENRDSETFNGCPVVMGKVGKGVRYVRIRRITGYLVGTVERFNNAKRAEVGDRVKHVQVV